MEYSLSFTILKALEKTQYDCTCCIWCSAIWNAIWDDVLYCDMTTRNHKILQVEDHPPNNNCCFWYLHVQKFLCFVSITNFLPCWLRKRKLFSCECANVCCSIELRWLELSLTHLTISNTTHTATSNAEFEVRYYSAKTWIHCRR